MLVVSLQCTSPTEFSHMAKRWWVVSELQLTIHNLSSRNHTRNFYCSSGYDISPSWYQFQLISHVFIPFIDRLNWMCTGYFDNNDMCIELLHSLFKQNCHYHHMPETHLSPGQWCGWFDLAYLPCMHNQPVTIVRQIYLRWLAVC